MALHYSILFFLVFLKAVTYMVAKNRDEDDDTNSKEQLTSFVEDDANSDGRRRYVKDTTYDLKGTFFDEPVSASAWSIGIYGICSGREESLF